MSDYHRPDNDPIVGETILAVIHSVDDDTLTFVCRDAAYRYSTEGDCCSQSWIEHLTVPPDIVGAQVTEVHSPELPPHEQVNEQDGDSIQVYHTAWKTNRGEVIAEYRNSSNGYYGGWMTGPEVIEL